MYINNTNSAPLGFSPFSESSDRQHLRSRRKSVIHHLLNRSICAAYPRYYIYILWREGAGDNWAYLLGTGKAKHLYSTCQSCFPALGTSHQ
jgi:hypothetical protein